MNTNEKHSDPDIILDVQDVWKVYCRNLKRSMRYGLFDLGRQLVGRGRERNTQDLRPGEFFAVKGASFQVRRGECVGMIGPNGAGKSTMLKMINGLIKPDAGRISIHGKIGALIELGTGFNPVLSGRENIYINAAVLGMKKAEVDSHLEEIVEFAELGHVIDDPVKTYSSGMRVRLGFSVAANLKPQLLIMDEVLAVGDVGFRMKCFAHLRNLVDSGVSIILVTHAVSMLQRVANRSIVFGRGNIVHDGELETGIAAYEEMMLVHDQKRKERDPLKENSDAHIEKIEVLNTSLQPQSDFKTGETLCLRVRLKCNTPVKNARLIATLASPITGPVASMSTVYHDCRFDVNEPGTTIVLRLPELPLLIGAFHFNISLYGPNDTDFYQRRSGQGHFRIVGPPTDSTGRGINGMVKLQHDWQVDG